MLNVLTPAEVLELIEKEFSPLELWEEVFFEDAVGRVLFEDVAAEEYVPDFNRSTVDGYALRAADSFGCSEAIPAQLPLQKEILMGRQADFTLDKGSCCYVPTGGALPEGADCVVMLEYSEDYGDGTIGIMKSGAPGLNMILRGDDVYPGKIVLNKGRLLRSGDIGAFAAIGQTEVKVSKKPVVGIISTGDELVPPSQAPAPGQMRDVNSSALSALMRENGARVISFGIVKDEPELLRAAVSGALPLCDVVLISGGSSVGLKDATHDIIESLGTLLLHGIAVKPGKPTILGKSGDKAIFGLPGHPAAAYFVAKTFVLPLLFRLSGRETEALAVKAVLGERVGANHGRAQYNAVKLKNGIASPIRSKSGLITQLAGADGYMCISRDCEGLEKGSEIEVYI